MNKVVIFDLDGTVIDSIEDIADAMNSMLVHYGFEKISIDEMKSALGGSSMDIVRCSIKKEIPNQLLVQCHDFYQHEYMSGGSPKTKPFKGIEKVITILKERGYKISALSNKPDTEIAIIFDRLLKPLGFDSVMGLSDKVEPKPNPSGALKILENFDANPETSYLVGDGETDVLTAINAKINSIGVLWGNRDKEFLSRYGAKVFAYTPEDLLELIK